MTAAGSVGSEGMTAAGSVDNERMTAAGFVDNEIMTVAGSVDNEEMVAAGSVGSEEITAAGIVGSEGMTAAELSDSKGIAAVVYDNTKIRTAADQLPNAAFIVPVPESSSLGDMDAGAADTELDIKTTEDHNEEFSWTGEEDIKEVYTEPFAPGAYTYT